MNELENYRIGFIVEEFEEEKTGETIQGVTFIIDDHYKKMFDQIKQKNSEYKDNVSIINDAIIMGINALIAHKKK